MKRANTTNLRTMKAELMQVLKLSDDQYKELVELATKKTWEDFRENQIHESFGQRKYMEAINKLVDGFGVESFYPDLPDVWYVNMGDAYNTTFLLKGGKLYIGTWADVAEKLVA